MTDNRAAGDRYLSLDAIRGIAVMGILAMNIVAFALPFPAYVNPAAGGMPSMLDQIVWYFNFVLIDGKMRGLFSILFGASTLLVIERAGAQGRGAAATHYARMFWLALFGLAHFYLIWFGDILFLYAICGLLLFLFRGLSAKALTRWAIGFLFIGFAFMGSSWAMLAMAQSGAMPPDAAASMKQALAEIHMQMGPDSPQYAKDIALYQGSYAGILAHRTGPALADPFVGIMMFLWETMGLMLIGMALFKSNMLTGGWEAARYRKWAIYCFAIAAPPLMALGWYQMSSGFDAVAAFGATMGLSIPFDVLMAVGWAALIMGAIQSWFSASMRDRVAAAGRMAFTNYLTTSVVMTTIFYGYGLGLYGHVGRAALYLFCFGMWAAMLAWSQPWLARFHYGPLEWLWRSLARWHRQPFRRS